MAETTALHETGTTPLTGERADLLAVLGKTRFFLRFTTRDLTDEQAASSPAPSELCLGGLIKHVTGVERSWADFIVEGTGAMKDFDDMTPEDFAARVDEFQLLPGETLAGVLDTYAEVAARTDAMIATVDLDHAWPLPQAPWFQEDAWSTRQVLLHIIAETAQHAGHADIIREAIDGQKTMG
ncbi:DinB family protein [Nocardia sp. NPDC019395]|uniref:DinB family protein n=1 Tax=Nocardia sp. NPDC019395 TaxID=3154686 RepID=UPI0033E17304